MTKKTHYPNLSAEISRYCIDFRALAKEMGFHESTLYRKIYGKAEWTLREISFLTKKFNLTAEYLFKKRDDSYDSA